MTPPPPSNIFIFIATMIIAVFHKALIHSGLSSAAEGPHTSLLSHRNTRPCIFYDTNHRRDICKAAHSIWRKVPTILCGSARFISPFQPPYQKVNVTNLLYKHKIRRANFIYIMFACNIYNSNTVWLML